MILHMADIINIVFLFALVCWMASSKVEAARTVRSHSSPYLYAGVSYPVVEFIASESASKTILSEELDELPFLSAADQGYRIVKFYPSRFDQISAQIRDSYIQLAYSITEGVKQHKSNVTFDAYAICCAAVPTICRRQGLDGTVPTFVVYKPGSSNGKILYYVNATTVFDAMGIRNVSSLVDGVTYQNIQIDLKALPKSTETNHHMRTVDDLKVDIYLSFHTLMRNFTFLDHDEHGKDLPMSLEKRTALKNYLLLIQKTIPPSWSIHVLVKQLINSFMYICKNKAYLLATLDAYQPSVTDYSVACQNGVSHVSGLTCGTWELIHAISVGVVERNTMMIQYSDSQFKSKDGAGSGTHQVISLEVTTSIIRDFVYHFGLGNDEIEGNLFVRHLNTCLDEKCLQINNISAMVSEWIKLPLFLSKTHTDITIKRYHDQAKKEGIVIPSLQQHNTAMWPPKRFCPRCWDEHGKWQTDVVYKYMQLEYTDLNEWSLSTPEIRRELLGINEVPLTESLQLFSTSSKWNQSKDRIFHNTAFLTIQKLVLIFSSLGAFLYRIVSNQNKKHQQAMLVLPQTIRTQISRNKSFKGKFASFIMDQKQS